MTPDEVARRFEARQAGVNTWSARCPSHEDHNASLSISAGESGGTVIFCHAGCTTAEVLTARGLTMADLAPPNRPRQSHRQVARYAYRDASGTLLFECVRYEPKDFRQRRPDGNGGWTWNLNGTPRVLYRLPELLAADQSRGVFIVEGEKDVDRLATLGYIATCNVGGASKNPERPKWRQEYNEHLRGRHVVIIPDADESGRAHALAVARSLHGTAASVRVLELPGLPEKGDVSDWLDAGHDAAQLLALARTAAPWQPGSDPEPRPTSQPTAADNGAPSILRDEHRTETANARRFVRMHGDNVRYVGPWEKWLVWDGRRWKIDDGHAVEALAKQTTDAIWTEVQSHLRHAEAATARALLAFAKATASARGVANMLWLARSEPGIPVLPTALDADPWLLNVHNGTIDLRSGRLRAHDKADMLTKLAPVEHNVDADCPVWYESLRTWMDDDGELMQFLRRLAGYWLTGSTRDHVLPIFHGAGANGKSVYLGTMLALLGPDYAMHAPPDLLMARKGDHHPTELADLHGKRLVAAIEVDAGRRLAESLIKSLTGGDRVRARRMREDFWEFTATHKIVIAGNHRPGVRGTDHAIWRRLRLVPWNVVIPPERRDPELPDRLREELPGILNWALLGCTEWQHGGLGEPPAITTATAEYRDSQDVLGSFVAECLDQRPLADSKASDVRKRYEDWCAANGETPVNARVFGDYLTSRGITRRKSHGTIFYVGITITAESNYPPAGET